MQKNVVQHCAVRSLRWCVMYVLHITTYTRFAFEGFRINYINGILLSPLAKTVAEVKHNSNL